jgi:hypothetical protein
MPQLTHSDLPDLARYPASLRSAARALWGDGVAGAAPATMPDARLHRLPGAAGRPCVQKDEGTARSRSRSVAR